MSETPESPSASKRLSTLKDRALGIVKRDKNLEQLYNEKGIKDYKFKQVKFEDFREQGTKAKLKYFITWLLSLKYLYGYIADALVINTIMSGENMMGLAVAYFIFFALSILFFGKDLVEAKKIVDSDDISDAFLNAESKRYYLVRSFEHYCFFNKIQANFKLMDKAAMTIFEGLKGWRRFVLVLIPQFAVTIAVLVSKEERCFDEMVAKGECQPYATVDECSPCDPSTMDSFSLTLKIVLLALEMFKLCLFFALYPCVRCWMANSMGTLKLGFRAFMTYRVDKRINEVVKGHLIGESDAESAKDLEAGSPQVEAPISEGVAVSVPMSEVQSPAPQAEAASSEPEAAAPPSAAGQPESAEEQV